MKPTRQFKSALLLSLLVAFSIAQAKNNVNTPPPTAPAFTQKTTAAPCDPPTSSIDLDINNVRTRIHNGGDMWWDLVGSAKYEIPKGSDIHSLFAASIWIGGVDAGGQLKIAAQTYRQSGNDFWPGPLDSNGATVKETCSDWDRHFEVSRLEIDAFIENPDVIPTSILQWPGKGNPNQPLVAPFSNIGLAPFEDANADGIYDPADGDFPILMDECPGVRGDQMIWWIYNDKGNIHTETRGEAIGMEVQAMAFGFSTNDEINDMTFYRYVLINRSNTTLDSAFIAQWVDPDLGCFQDDYIGCDTSRSLGIVYNADATDEQCGSNGYGSEIPMLGIDYFRGPKDEFGKELGMSSFTYYLNDFSLMGNPESAPHYYGYLSGTWKDGTPFTCGGIAKGGSQTCKYVFPDDPTLPLPAWSECSVNTPPLDRRFVQASGPFSLAPGASNDVIVGVVWVSNVVYPCPSYKTLQAADDKAQALFDACFKLVDGPDAPDLTIRELENELILTLTNKDGSNNYKESYSQVDPTIISDVEKIGSADSAYIFEGYKIYQLASDIISIADVDDPDKARLVAQVDIENGIDQLINYTFDNLLGADVATEMVDGDDLGIVHTFKITQDQFALGDKTLINHWPYYFTAVAYAYNIYQPYDPANDTLLGQKKEYLEGRNNVKVYSAIPHKSDPLSGGTKLNSEYGDGPLITRIEGSGNGGRVLDLTDATVDLFFSKSTSFIKHLVYQENLGPIDVKVYDPLLVPKDGFKFYMQDTAGIKMGCFYPEIDKSSTWTLIDTTRGDTTQADRNLSTKNEQLFPD
ncbi:MAG: hypothetical protein IIA45_12165 [Bacteroidetes bacterium]|nr:hypothetical protein [Bacteroidota bacterium]